MAQGAAAAERAKEPMMATYSKGLEGVIAAETKLSFIDGEKGVLEYIGVPIGDLASHSTFEETVFLLWNRRLPTKAELAALCAEIRAEYDLPEGYRHLYSGKVRDLYEGPNGQLLFIASDRISAYDWVLPTEIPDKGRILTELSLWWFDRMQGVVPNHLVSTQVPKSVRGRAMLCEPLEMMPVECVVRGYLAGSGLTEYVESRAICGNGLPPGLKDGSKLPKPIFTPATKAPMGEHDVNITYDETIVLVGQEEAQDLKRLSLDVYRRAAVIAEERGLILADTKFEFGIARAGRYAGRMVLGDEVLTPDSSRYWPIDQWEPGRAQPSYDKQFVRDWLTSPASGWSKDSGDPPPPLPDEIVEKTRAKYVEAYELLTGDRFA
jgi:phosphoribosylaminoimidazole-succinocarboxamide synthase